MTDRKQNLAALCRLEIQRTAALIRMALNDHPRPEVSDAVDAEFWSMLPRIRDKPVLATDLPLLRGLILAELGQQRVVSVIPDQKVDNVGNYRR